MEKWYVHAKKADFNEWAQELKISPVVARILRNRDIESIEQARKFLYGTMEDCHDPYLLKDMGKCVDILLENIEQGKKIRVIGDYDVDGICSSYILTKGISILGGDVDTVIPHRIHDGYGLNDNLIEDAKREKVDLIITCDNGISAFNQIELANKLGIGVLITDHHEVPLDEEKNEIIPNAMAVVDPKQKTCTYPFSGICGGMVVFKLMQAILQKTGNRGLERAIDEFTEFAALATVCDVMELLDENRIIVKRGLELMKNSSNEGLKALIEVNELDKNKISAYHLGFVIGPCLNATGRLDSASRALELLQSLTKVDASTIARELKELNDSRKNLTIEGVEAAFRAIEDKQMLKEKILVIYLPDVHESLAGIIAGRVKEQTGKPTFVLTKGEEGVKGSGRSIEAYNMYEALLEVKELLSKFGGHKLAAGLSLAEENVDSFRESLNRNCSLSDDDFISKIYIDVPMPMSYASEALYDELALLEPYGVGNPKPLFAERNTQILSATRIGKNKNYAKLKVKTDDGAIAEMMLFSNLDRFTEFVADKYGEDAAEQLFFGKSDINISVTYQLGLNNYNGKKYLQYIIQNYC